MHLSAKFDRLVANYMPTTAFLQLLYSVHCTCHIVPNCLKAPIQKFNFLEVVFLLGAGPQKILPDTLNQQNT